jgi:hypothetical protein
MHIQNQIEQGYRRGEDQSKELKMTNNNMERNKFSKNTFLCLYEKYVYKF